MITFEKHILSNGLTLLVNPDKRTPLVSFNLLYKVGARDEDPRRTGFAHLFEHLMFEGSANIPDYDRALEIAGGENNAYTTNDYTNYYLTLPAQNLETAFWLESDRMLGLAFSEERLQIQKQVVMEEFRQRYLNQPYGDVWLLLRELAYKVHPYRWPTIGKDISHIEKAGLQEVRDFFYKFYLPNNAILSVSGLVDTDQLLKLAEKWFSPIPSGERPRADYPMEPAGKAPQRLQVSRKVPNDVLYIVWHMVDRRHPDYYVFDLISDLLSHGRSSRIYRKLVQEQKLFTEANAWISGDLDPGLFILYAKPREGISLQQAEEALLEEIRRLAEEEIPEEEMEKVKNKFESNLIYSRTQALNRAMALAIHEMISEAGEVNNEVKKYRSIQKEDVSRVCNQYLQPAKRITLEYMAEKNAEA